MNKFLLLFFQLFCCFAFAQKADKELRISSFNDSWGGGFTPIYDDLRTYGFNASYQKKGKYKIDASFSYLTDKFYADSSALDEFLLAASFPVLHQKGKNKTSFWLKGGTVIRGALLGKLVQDVAHSLFGVEENNLHYQKGTFLHPLLGYQFNTNLVSFNSTLALSFEHNLSYAIGYGHKIYTGIPLSYFANNVNVMKMSLGYSFSKSYVEDNHLLSTVFETESNVNIRFSTEGKTLFYFYEIYLETGFSLGGIGIKLGSSIKDSIAYQSPLSVAISVLTDSYGYNFKYAYKVGNVLKRELSLILNHHFYTLLKRSIPDYPTVNGHVQQLSLGAEIDLLQKRELPRIFNPYINLSVGEKGVSIYRKNDVVAREISYHLAINNDIGIRVNIPSKNRDKSWCFNFFHRLMWMSDTPHESAKVNQQHSPYRNWQAALGAGIVFRL